MAKIDELLKLEESRSTTILDIMKEISESGVFEKRVASSAILDGAVALFRGKDGNAYEVTVVPAENSLHKNLFKKYLIRS